MYALSAEVGGRTVRAEGAVIALPAPAPPAVLARAGYPALALPARVGKPLIESVDYDAVGSAAVGGVAPANARVQLSVDGQPADIDIADAGGRFALTGPRTRPLAPSGHVFTVASAQGADEARVALSPAPPLGALPARATRAPEGWRLDWAAPGGGVQTTLVLDRPAL